MATRKYGISRDEKYNEVTEAVGSATTDGVEVTIDLAKIDKASDAIDLLEKVKHYIAQNIWPPA